MQVWAVVLFGAAVAGSVSRTRVAHAGCPNPCDLTVGQPTIEPDLPCAEVEADIDDCDCEVTLDVFNRCTIRIVPVDFAFDSCWSLSGQTLLERDCSVVEPETKGLLRVKFDSIGEKETSLLIRSDGIDHTLRVTSNVTSLGSGGLCAIGRVPVSRHLSSEFLAVALGLASAAIGRRAARAQRSRR
jgi:hypothetical protein